MPPRIDRSETGPGSTLGHISVGLCLETDFGTALGTCGQATGRQDNLPPSEQRGATRQQIDSPGNRIGFTDAPLLGRIVGYSETIVRSLLQLAG